MKLKNWILYFFVGAMLGFVAIAGFNIITDPFGIFNDRLFNWYGYNMTMNPRIAKIGYLDKNYEKYDSYIIGSSKTSSLNPTQLNKYYKNANFYNMLMYGADLKHIEQTVNYIVENYKVSNIIINIGISELQIYDRQTNDTKEELHGKVSGDEFDFYLKYLTLNPKYGIDKINAYFIDKNKVKPTKNDVFLPELGVYNKSIKDKENIININDYVEQTGDKTFTTSYDYFEADNYKLCVEAIQRMKKLCNDNDISFLVISSPNYDVELSTYNLENVKKYWTMLSKVTDFWNFSGYNEISSDPRFFYDSVHFKNFTGEIMLAKIFNDSTYFTDFDFGEYFTKDNSEQLSDKLLTKHKDLSGYSDLNVQKTKVKLPILMYHHIVPNEEDVNLATITVDKFISDLTELKKAGYTTIFLSEALKFANGELESLPEKPVIITFDDGYLSNYTYAYSILKQMGMKANINIIGWSIGRSKRLDEKTNIIPHFDLDQLNEMKQSNVIEFNSHSYDLHVDGEAYPFRKGALKKDDETQLDYYFTLKNDYDLFIDKTAFEPNFFCYPYGFSDFNSDLYLRKLGFKGTIQIGSKVGTIIKNSPYSLYGLYRINASYDIDSKSLVDMLK